MIVVRILAAGAALFALTAGSASAQGDDPTEVRPSPDDAGDVDELAGPTRFRSKSLSVGVADRGRLRNGARVAKSPHVVGRRGSSYGTRELVELLGRAAARVAEDHPGSKLRIGDLSSARGGRIRPHRSHQSGRDADIGFYLSDPDGGFAEPGAFVNIGRDMTGEHREQTVSFDVVRNWALLEALLTDPVARVQYVFVAEWLREALLSHAEAQGVPEELRAHAQAVLHRDPGNAHRNHFHVRIYCPVDDRPHCVDEPPYHDFYAGEPPPPDVRRRLSRRRAQQRDARRLRQQRVQRRARAQQRARHRARGR